jgi:peptide/nickel transport system substrate-binding protein
MGIQIKMKFTAVRWKRGASLLLSFLMAVSVCNWSTEGASAAQGDKLLKIGVTEDVGSVNPFAALSVSSCRVFQCAYDSLDIFDKDLNPVGDLAKSWDLSADKLTWTFHLNQGVKWHDGKPFTSADVKFTYETMIKSGAGLFAKQLDGISSITTPDETTVVIKTKEPKANMLYNTVPILPKHIWGGVDVKKIAAFDNSACIGTGPYKMVAFKKADSCTLEANKDYFLGAPKFDGVVFKTFANNDSMAQALKLGEINVAENLLSTQAKSIAANSPNIKLYKSQSNSFEDLAFNCNTAKGSKGNKALTDVQVRRALEKAIDKQSIISIAFNGDGTPGTTLIPPANSKWHYEPQSGEINTYDSDAAGKALDGLGYSKINKDGFRENAAGNVLNLRLFARTASTEEVKAAEMVKSYLNKIHVGATISTMDDDALTDKITNSDFDLFIWNWSGDVDPSTLLDIVTTAEIGNLSDTYYSNSKYDDFYNKQLTQIDAKARQESVFAAQKIALKEVPYSVLLFNVEYEVVRTDMISDFVQINGDGSIFYGDTPYNYTHAAYGPMQSPSSVSASATAAPGSAASAVPAAAASAAPSAPASSNAAIWVVILIVAAGVIFAVVRRKKKNPEDED